MLLIEAVLANKDINVKEIKEFKIGDIIKIGENSHIKINNEKTNFNLKHMFYVNDANNICIINKKQTHNLEIKLRTEKDNESKNKVIENELSFINYKLEKFDEKEISLIIEKNNIYFSSILLKYLDDTEKKEKIKLLLNEDLKLEIEKVMDKTSKSKINYINIVFDFFEKELEKQRIKNKVFI